MEGFACLIDDILVFGKDQWEHDDRLYTVMKKLQEAGLTLNRAKCEFCKTQVKFLGQVLTKDGVQSDPAKVAAIINMRDPTCVSEVRRYLGMANQLSKFTPHLANTTKPLRDLLSKKNQWSWGHPQKRALAEVKEALTKHPTLALFDPERPTTVSADASSYDMGAVLLQKQACGENRPVAYISRFFPPNASLYAASRHRHYSSVYDAAWL